MQYSLIAKSLLTTVLEYLEKREIEERSRRTESSSQLFGLIPQGAHGDDLGSPFSHQGASHNSEITARTGSKGEPSSTIEGRLEQGFDFEACVHSLSDSFPITPDFSLMPESFGTDGDQAFGAMNLFPLLDTDGHIDLANFF